jgi:hypothetical protein
VKLRPLNSKGKKPEILNDLMDLLENSGTEKFEASNNNLAEKSNNEDSSRGAKESKLEELNMAAILTFHYYAIGKQDYLNTSKIYRLVKRETDVVTQIDFDGFPRLISLAVGMAFKISIDKYIEGELETTEEDFKEYERSTWTVS